MKQPPYLSGRVLWHIVILTVILIFPAIVFADTVTGDADIITPSNQSVLNLGNVTPGQVINTPVSFVLTCAGKQHVDLGQTVSLTYTASGSTIPVGGSLSATTSTIGPIPAVWPDDTTGGGSTNCPSPAPVLNDNGDSVVTITAPALPGSYSFIAKYNVSLSPAGASDSSAITGSSPALTFNLTVIQPDNTPPVITPIVNGTLGNNGWYISDVSVSWTVVDNESAVSSTSGCGTTVINSDTSGQTLTCSATSDGGTNSHSLTIKRDATPPTIVSSASPAANGNGWNNTAVTVSFSCSDSGSGIDNNSVAGATLNNEGINQSVTSSGSCTDKAGNTADPASVGNINIDLTAPTVNASASPAANGNGWNNSNVTVTFSGSDTLSGIDSCDSAVVLSNEGAGQSASGGCKDNAGNTASQTKSGINIDKTAPTGINFVGDIINGGSYYFGFVPAAPTCTANGDISGLATCVVSGYGNGKGSHTLMATAVDNADNSANSTLNYTVLGWTLTGFYSPVDMGTNVWNTVKGGSTVPLKFRIFAGPTEITDISMVSMSTKMVSCVGGTEDPVDVDMLSSGSTTLRYDTTEMQFIQNWKTPKQPGKCYEVKMTANDGSSIVAYFKLK